MPSPTEYVVVTSAERNTGDNVYDFRVQSDRPVFWQGCTYGLHDVYMSNTLYTFDTSNNKIYFQENAGIAATATITPGVYDITTLPAQIKTQMEAVSPNVRTYTITYSSSTMKFTIAVSAGTFQFLFGTNTTSSAAQRLGWSTYKITATDDTKAASLTSPYLIDLAYPLQIAINIDLLESSITSGKKSSFCQAIIPFDAPVGSTMRYQPPSPPIINANLNITQLHVSLTDPLSGQLVQLQQDFALVFKKLY